MLGLLPKQSVTDLVFGSSVPKLVDQYMQGEIPLEDFVTDRMKLDDINQAFEKLHEGSCLRCVIDMS